MGDDIRVISLDWDNMLADQAFIDELNRVQQQSNNKPLSDKQYKELAVFIVKRHKQFFDSMMTLVGNPNREFIFMLGSNRQDLFADFNNGALKRSGSCFPVFAKLIEAIQDEYKKNMFTIFSRSEEKGISKKQIILNKMLYSDAISTDDNRATQFITFENGLAIAAKLASTIASNPETTVRAIENLSDVSTSIQNSQQFDYHPDSMKISLLFFQMQCMASLHPNQKIKFIYSDDGSEIIKALYEFYQKYSGLIPPNMKLQLQVYNYDDASLGKHVGKSVELFGELAKIEGMVTDKNIKLSSLPEIQSTAKNKIDDYKNVLLAAHQASKKPNDALAELGQTSLMFTLRQ